MVRKLPFHLWAIKTLREGLPKGHPDTFGRSSGHKTGWKYLLYMIRVCAVPKRFQKSMARALVLRASEQLPDSPWSSEELEYFAIALASVNGLKAVMDYLETLDENAKTRWIFVRLSLRSEFHQFYSVPE